MKRTPALQILIFIFVRTIVNTSIRMVYPLLPVFARGLGIGLPTLAGAMSLRSAAGLFSPFLGSVADNRGRKTGMIVGLTLFTIGVVLPAVWPGLPAFVLMLTLTIMGNFMLIAAMQAYLGDQIPYRKRGLVIAATELSWSFAFIFGVPAVTFLIARNYWSSAFPALAIAGLVAIALLSIILPKDPPVQEESPRVLKNLGAVFSDSPALAGIGIGVAISLSNELVNLIFGVWLEESFGVKIAALALASVVIGGSELGGELLVTGLVDRLGKLRAVRYGLVLNCLAALALPWLGRSQSGAMIGLALLYLTFEFTLVSSIPLMTEVIPKLRATVMATFIASTAVGRSAGDLLSPALYSLGKALTPASAILLIVLAAVAINIVALALSVPLSKAVLESDELSPTPNA